MVKTYEIKLNLKKTGLKLSTGTSVDFMATVMADACETSDGLMPTWKLPCPDEIEYTRNGEFNIVIDQCISANPEVEEYELTDDEYNEIVKYCEDNFDDFDA